jgi:hypothetical protein
MNKTLQVYYHTIFGALGGLLGWWVMGSFATQSWNIWVAAAFVGAGLGLCIGGLVAAADGAMIKRVPLRAIHEGLLGALAGAGAGLIGLLLAQGVWLILSGGFFARALTWMLLGLLVGLGDMLIHRRMKRAMYAALGGMAGGLIGGFIYEGLTQLFLAQSGSAQVVVGGIGLVIVGACIGGLIPFARQVLSQGELRVLDGQQVGLVREVTDRTSIGYYDGNDLYLPDGGISWRHASVRRTDGGFELEVLPEAESEVYVGMTSVAPGTTHPLQSGDHIRIGEALVQFTGRYTSDG